MFLFCLCQLSRAQETSITFTSSLLQEAEVYLGYHLAEQKFIADTLTVATDGVVEIKNAEGYRPGLYFLYQPNSFYQEFVINEAEFSIQSESQAYDQLVIQGSRENEVFQQFQLEMGALQRERAALADSLQGLSGKDSLAVSKQLETISKESEEFRKQLFADNPDLLISKMIRLMSVVPVDNFDSIEDVHSRQRAEYNSYRKEFKRRLDFAEIGLLRTPVFKTNVMRYVTQVIPQVPDTIKAELDWILAEVADDEASFRYWLVTFTNEYQNSKMMGMDAVLVHLLKSYYLTGRADWATEESLQKMREEVAFLEPNQIGQPAPRLALVDTMYAPMNPLEELSEDFIVLYFYDPDCGHCKKKTPILRDNYYDLKDLGAEVVAVCTISDVKKWKDYIRENELDWINLADPNSQSRFKMTYDIRSTPRVYVLDKSRKIIAKRLDVEQLVQFITNYRRIVTDEVSEGD